MFNSKYGIYFKFDPFFQCTLGRFTGYMIVMDALRYTRDLRENDKILFTYSNSSQWNKLVKHIQTFNK